MQVDSRSGAYHFSVSAFTQLLILCCNLGYHDILLNSGQKVAFLAVDRGQPLLPEVSKTSPLKKMLDYIEYSFSLF